MRETWLVLEDGTVVDPLDCAADDKGELRHKSGVAVAKRGDAYSSRGVDDADAERAKSKAKPAAETKEVKAPDDREMKPRKGGRGVYETR